jgi:hypothetical protein
MAYLPRHSSREELPPAIPPETPMRLSRNCRRGLVALVLASLTGCVRAPGSATAPGLVGAWRSSVQFSSGVFAPVKDLEFMYVFNLGGTMSESSNYDASPPAPPAYGEWRKTGAGRFEAKYTFFTTSPPSDVRTLALGGGWPPAGSGELTERIVLAADGRSYDSSLTLVLHDTAGRPIAGGGDATVHATRAGF